MYQLSLASPAPRSAARRQDPTLSYLFVYGTLRQGDVRWKFLEPFVVDAGTDDAVSGELFDTGLGYPAARFDGAPDDRMRVRGRTYELIEASVGQALHDLDIVEGAVRGLYQRIRVQTENGYDAWVYQFGADPDIELHRIAGGDWSALD